VALARGAEALTTTTRPTESSTWLRRVVGRASTLYERMQGPYVPVATDPRELERRLETWEQRVGGPKFFEQRLRFDGLDRMSARACLADMELAAEAGLPDWAKLLARVSERMKTAQPLALQDPSEPVAFEELFADFAFEANAAVQEQTGDRYHRIAPSGHQHLRRALLLTLAWFSGQTLALEFRVFREQRESHLARVLRRTRGDKSDRLYRAFIAHHRADGLHGLALEYAALARLLASVTAMWIDTTVELVSRLDEDHAALCESLCSGHDPGRVTRIVSGLSDRHDHGRVVSILCFESGDQVVYKPRDQRLESAWFRFLRALEAPIEQHVVETLERPGYGWAAHVPAIPFPEDAEVDLYYRRVGGLLAVLYLLAATDCHYENLIASGTSPVLVDGETIMHHALHRTVPSGLGGQLEAVRRLDRSILRPGLIPHWEEGAGEIRDRSGLAAEVPTLSQREFATYDGIGTDDLELAPRRIALPDLANVPVRGGRRTSVLQHQGAFIEGVQDTLGFVARHRSRVAALLDDFAGLRSRFVFRATSVYARLLEEANHPDLMRSGIDRSIHFDALARQREPLDAPPPWWPLLRAEQDALAHLDVPRFFAPVDDDHLLVEDRAVEGLLEGSSLELVRERIRTLDEETIAEQVELVRASLYSYDIDRSRLELGATQGPRIASDQAPPMADHALLDEAVRIGQCLADVAVRGDDGSRTWIGLEPMPSTTRFRLQPISPMLYGGSLGVGVFYAALHAATDDERWRAMARATVAHILADASTGGRQRIVTADHGGVSGVGAMAYCLCSMADHTGDTDYLRAASVVARLLTKAVIEADRVHDVCHGAAGTILGLLPLWRRTQDETVLRAALCCGEHLLASSVIDERTGTRTWKTIESRPLTGMSHGSAGIAMALARLAEAAGDARFTRAAAEALEFERAVYVPGEGNWPDFRGADGAVEHRCMISWCHGAPGIGLARAAMVETHRAAVTDDLERAAETTLGAGVSGCDNLCCGNFGRFDALLAMSTATGRGELVTAARRLAASAIARAHELDGYDLLPGVPRGLVSPGFFQGLSGIGYMALRLMAPERFVSVLQWQDSRA
jgi:type 2 lantibiotic biosynthesis protein LanM